MKKWMLGISVILVFVNAIVFAVGYTSKDRDPYHGAVKEPPVYTEGVSKGEASDPAAIAVAAYQNGWYHLVKGEQIMTIGDLGPHEDGISIDNFPVIANVNRVLVASDNFVGPVGIVDAVYVTKNKKGDYVATACEFQEPKDVRVITDTGNADTLEGTSGWRVTMKRVDGRLLMTEIVENSETCKKVRSLKP